MYLSPFSCKTEQWLNYEFGDGKTQKFCGDTGAFDKIQYISPTPKEQTEIKSNDETRKTEPKRHYFYCLSVDVNHKWAFG